MTEKEGYTSSIYQGGYSTFDSNKGEFFTGYRATGGSLGVTTDLRTANVIKDASSKLSSGAKHIELVLVSPEVFDSVPKQQLTEVKQLAKLIGTTVSLHGPVSGVDPSGFSQNGWSEVNRQASERKIIQALNRSHDADPSGNIIVTFHTAEGVSGTEWDKIPDAAKGDVGQARRLVAVDREKGQPTALEAETLYYPGSIGLKPSAVEKINRGELKTSEVSKEHYEVTDFSKGKLQLPEDRLNTINHTQWDNELTSIEFQRERAQRILGSVDDRFREMYTLWASGNLNQEKVLPGEMEEIKKIYSAAQYMKEASLSLSAAFHKAYKYAKEDGDKEKLNYLNALQDQYKKQLGFDSKGGLILQKDPKIQIDAVFNLLQGLDRIPPNQFIPIEEFSQKQASKTFGSAAFESYKKFGDSAPVVSIENPPAGFGMSTGEDLRTLVQKSREQFAKKAVEEKGISESDAKKLAEKFIGATWDVGHINMIRGKGHSEKDVIKETEKIAPYLKHVHLSDNFGFEHTELPMGMGNVPIKEMMEKLGKKGFEAKKVIEAAQWWQHFQTNPLGETMQAFGSPMYMESAGPYWNQSLGFQQGYMGGLAGQWLPSNNYEMFGAGFSRLPQELGGSVGGGAGGRMGGGRD